MTYLLRLKNDMISSGIPKVVVTGTYAWDHENCLLYGVARCPLFRDCLSIEVNGRTVGTFRIVHYEVIQECACWSTMAMCIAYWLFYVAVF